MKVLLDENIDIRFKKAFSDSGHEVYTVRDMQWNGLKNGALLEAMNAEQFDILVAVDKNLPYQQNPDKLSVSIFILDVHRNILANLLPYTAILLEAWEETLEHKVYILKV